MPIILNNGDSVNFLSEISPNDYRFEKWKFETSYYADQFFKAYEYFGAGIDILPDLYFSEKKKRSLSNTSLKHFKTLSKCSPSLTFALDSENNYRLKEAFFCRSRFCLLCNWRRRLKLGYRFYSFLEDKLDQYNIIFFTATIPNCPLSSLKNSCDILVKAYNNLFGLGNKITPRLRNQGLFDQKYHLGSFRNIEITRRFTGEEPEQTYSFYNKENIEQIRYFYTNKAMPPFFFDYHPHIHAILLFDKSLDLPPHNCFGTDNKNNWVSLWASALLKSGLDYPLFYKGLESGDPRFLPSVRVRLIGGSGDRFNDLEKSDCIQEAKLKSDIYESCKYGFDVSKFSIKDVCYRFIDQDYPGFLEAHLAVFADQLFNYRFLSTYGCLRGISLDDDNLITINDQDSSHQVLSNLKMFHWSKKHNHYLFSS